MDLVINTVVQLETNKALIIRVECHFKFYVTSNFNIY